MIDPRAIFDRTIDSARRVGRIGQRSAVVPDRVERAGYRGYYRIVDMSYGLGLAMPKRTVAGYYWSYEPTNPHGRDPGLAAIAELPSDATVFDVGAHVGEFATPLAVGTSRRIVAFEPNGVSVSRLARTVRRNDVGDSVIPCQVGIGDSDGERTFYRSSFSKCSAFDREQATRWGARVAGTETVPVRRIDDLVTDGLSRIPSVNRADHDWGSDALPRPDAIKVDVEGTELSVLRGAEETIRESRPLLVVEVHGGADDGSPIAPSAPGSDSENDAAAVRRWLVARDYAIRERGDVLICRG